MAARLTWQTLPALSFVVTTKIRVDQLLTDQGLAASRTEAQRLIMAGLVYIGDRAVDKPGQQVADDVELTVKGKEHPFVSRGGMKLQAALDAFALDVNNFLCLDVGASTGGFTDCLLQRGAAKVYAVDVGYGQLAHKLQVDPRVVVLDKTNARNLTAAEIPEAPDLIVCDASFISLKTVLPASMDLAKPGAIMVSLIKPQFEVGKDNLGKGGVVRDPAQHEAVCGDIKAWLATSGWTVLGLTDSPITGPAGNKEFLVYAQKAQG